MAVNFDSLNRLHIGLRVLISLVPVLIIGVIFYVALVGPKFKKIKSLKAEIRKLDADIETDRQSLGPLPPNEMLTKATNEYADIMKYVPRDAETSSLLTAISDITRLSGLKLINWSPFKLEKNSNGIVYTTDIKFEMIGTYHQFGDFLSRLARIERIVNVKTALLTAGFTYDHKPFELTEGYVLSILVKIHAYSAVEGAIGLPTGFK
ncbi:type IV pilus biogenesis protein PilO [Candidatus Magnetobacterium bavaricum]|uniref:Type IV pilus biogenesis protein PilO n=1 Tax=Candidatus Magnetobacterium bavaricum TaxID=29290 RepID=A0A0F3GWU1_9BACT|nr:type IV pilus biogenesis protein PilO [Candidatus Magnetobacterium bavaricum]